MGTRDERGQRFSQGLFNKIQMVVVGGGSPIHTTNITSTMLYLRLLLKHTFHLSDTPPPYWATQTHTHTTFTSKSLSPTSPKQSLCFLTRLNSAHYAPTMEEGTWPTTSRVHTGQRPHTGQPTRCRHTLQPGKIRPKILNNQVQEIQPWGWSVNANRSCTNGISTGITNCHFINSYALAFPAPVSQLAPN